MVEQNPGTVNGSSHRPTPRVRCCTLGVDLIATEGLSLLRSARKGKKLSDNIHVFHNEAESRFEVRQEGHRAELTYQRSGKEILFTATWVPAALEGRGIAGALVRSGLDYAREQQLTVEPLCPFVKSYIGRKPEYQGLVKQESTGGFA